MAVRLGSIFIFLSIAIATAREITNQFQDGQTLQCPDGWRQNRDRCLYFSQDHGEYVKTWNEARDICMLYTLPLVSIRDSKDRDQIYGKQITYSGSYSCNNITMTQIQFPAKIEMTFSKILAIIR